VTPAPGAPTFHGFGAPAGAGDGLASPTAARREPLDVSALDPDDLLAVRRFLDRRADLPAAVRSDLARRIASALAPRVGGATGHLTDEGLLEQVSAAKARAGERP
jgi:hypothetical protein